MTAATRQPVPIRAARAADVSAIMGLERASFGAEAWDDATMRAEVASPYGTYFVATDPAGGVVGYAGLRAVGREGDVQTIAVSAAERGRGIGRALMATLLEEAGRLGVSEMFLDVRADNEPARALYTSLGFAQIGVRRGYYQPDNVDAIVMRRTAS